jgi:hypothetical protein
MNPRPSAVAFIALLGACAGPAPVAPPPPLGYAVPAPPSIEYVVADSARAELDAAGQSLALNVVVGERWRMEFSGAGEGVRVTATLTDMDARMTSPLSAPQTADESAVSGPLVFTLDRRGRAAIETLPTIRPAVAQLLSGAGIAHTFFPRLPGRAVSTGDRWTDTVAYVSEEGGAQIDVSTVSSYTVVGDSVADGATYLLVRMEGTTAQASAGTISGTDFHQEVSGTTSGHFLWNRAAGIVHASELRSDLGGTMEVTIVPVPLGVRVRSTVRVRRAGLP